MTLRDMKDHMRESVGTGWFDNSLRALIVSNVVTIVIAVIENWTLSVVLFIYWTQSVIIGVFHIRRMLDLGEFTTSGLTMNGRSVEATPKSKKQIASFFSLHYGFFHFVYLVFVLTAINSDGGLPSFGWLGLIGGGSVFAVNHFFSYIQNRDLDRTGKPNLGTMLFLPYARIVPMHLIIVLGAAFGGSRVALVVFLSLKTLADAVMHTVEHRALRRVPATP